MLFCPTLHHINYYALKFKAKNFMMFNHGKGCRKEFGISICS